MPETKDDMALKKLKNERLCPHEIALDSKNGISETKIIMYSLTLLITYVSYFLCHGILERIKEKINISEGYENQISYLTTIQHVMWIALIVVSIISLIIMVLATINDPVYRREVGLDCDRGGRGV